MNVRSRAYTLYLVRLHPFSREKNAAKYAVPHKRSSFLIGFQDLRATVDYIVIRGFYYVYNMCA